MTTNFDKPVGTEIAELAGNIANVDSKFSINIASNTDLNTLKAPGMYYCTSSSIGQTLSNSPVTGAFSMLVMTRNATNVRTSQTIFYGNIIYSREATSTGFNHWFQFTGTDTGS